MRIGLDSPQVTHRQRIQVFCGVFVGLVLIASMFATMHHVPSASLRGFCVVGLVGTGLFAWGLVLCLTLLALGGRKEQDPCAQIPALA